MDPEETLQWFFAAVANVCPLPYAALRQWVRRSDFSCVGRSGWGQVTNRLSRRLLSVVFLCAAASTATMSVAAATSPASALVAVEVINPDLQFVGATNGSYSFTTNESDVTYNIDVANTGATAVTNVGVHVSPLTGPSGTVKVPKVMIAGGAMTSPGIYTVPTGEILSISIGARLTQMGDYTGSLRLLVGGVTTDIASLKITRTVNDLPVTLSATGPFRKTTALVAFRDSTTSTRLRIKVQDSSGRGRDLTVSVEVNRADPNSSEAITATSIRLDDPCDKKRPDCVRVGAWQAKTVSGTVSGLPVPGQYTATVTVGDGSHTPKSVDASIFIRRSGWVAAALILVGVLISAGLSLLPGIQSKRKRQQRITSAAKEIRRVVRARGPSADVVPVLEDRISVCWAEAEDGTDGVDTRINTLQLQVSLLDTYVTVRLLAESFHIPMPKQLADARDALLASAMDAGAKTTAVNNLDAARKVIVATQAVGPALNGLERALTQWKSESNPAQGDIDSITMPLSAAREALKTGDGSTARQKWDDAVHTFATVLARGLAAAVASESNPEWLAGIEWENAVAVATMTTTEIESAPAGDINATALLDKYLGVVRKLVATEAAVLARTASTASLSPGANATLKASLEQVATLAQSAATAASNGRVQDATKLLQSAIAKYNDASGMVQQEGVTSAGALATVDPLQEPPIPATPPTPTPTPIPKTSVFLWLPLEILLFLVAFSVATLIGWQALYVNNGTWGTWSDAGAAFLWGLGLSGATYGGFRPMLKRLSSEPTAPAQ